jgi:putative lipoic acid-binding regulatory protein
MNEPEAPKIEFPCEYPIKVLGVSSDAFETIILEVFQRHAPGFDQRTVAAKASRNGTYTSLAITIIATGPDQLHALHQDLMATGHVKMVI